jgi:hypothetical protein
MKISVVTTLRAQQRADVPGGLMLLQAWAHRAGRREQLELSRDVSVVWHADAATLLRLIVGPTLPHAASRGLILETSMVLLARAKSHPRCKFIQYSGVVLKKVARRIAVSAETPVC